MKKTILGIVLTMVLMSTYLVILLSSINHKHEVELNKVKTEGIVSRQTLSYSSRKITATRLCSKRQDE